MKIVCISGKAQHGKDTTAKLLEETLEAQGNRVLIAHYGDLDRFFILLLRRVFLSVSSTSSATNGITCLSLILVSPTSMRSTRPTAWTLFCCG